MSRAVCIEVKIWLTTGNENDRHQSMLTLKENVLLPEGLDLTDGDVDLTVVVDVTDAEEE